MRANRHYTVSARHPASHFFTVSLRIAHPDPGGQTLWLPNWILGSYMIRDFARHIVSVSARNPQGLLLDVKKIAKNRWFVAPTNGELLIEYDVYAWDLSVRGSHLDQTHGYFNPPCLLLGVAGQESEPVTLELMPPLGSEDWRVATGLEPQQVDGNGFGIYRAADYETLLDHPVEMGLFTDIRFQACEVPHRVAITGRHRADRERLAADLTRICSTIIGFWQDAAPFTDYLFQVMAVGNGYGGLEHRNSTSLLCSRDDLPLAGMSVNPLPDKYKAFLGLCSHEYFHAWLVKRIRPAELCPPDWEQENYTRLLWVFEGFTSYYDDLMLARAGVLTPQEYLDTLAQTITRYLKNPGRYVQSVTDSSFDAWTKYYKPDENTPNSVVSYYVKGSLVALCIDLTLRDATGGQASLDTLMRRLWREHGRTGRGVEPDSVQKIAEELAPGAFEGKWADWLYGTAELPLKPLLEQAGVRITLRAEPGGERPAASLGIRGQMSDGAFLIQQVVRGGAAEAAGLSAGDAIIAVDGLKVSSALEKTIASYAVDATLCIHAFRRDELMTFDVRLKAAAFDSCSLALGDGAARERAEQWILDQH